MSYFLFYFWIKVITLFPFPHWTKIVLYDFLIITTTLKCSIVSQYIHLFYKLYLCYNQPDPIPKEDSPPLMLRVSVAFFRRALHFSLLVLCDSNLITNVTIAKSELNNVCVKFIDRYRLNQ